MSARTIYLRRPPVLSVQDGMFLPAGAQLAEVDRRWAALCAANPAFFDGRLYHVLGVHRNGHGGATIHVVDCAYRFHAVQNAGFDLGVRPLGVKGLTWRDGRVLLGRRSQHVNAYRGLWEFAPGGVVEPESTPQRTVLTELGEETGLATAREPVAIAIVFDEVLLTWEIFFRLEGVEGEAEPRTNEYDELAWCGPDELPKEMSPLARSAAGLLR